MFVVQFFGKPAPAALAQRGGADGGAVSPDEFLFSGQVLGTSTSMLEQFLSSPESPQKQVFYVLLGVFVFLLAVGFVFGKRFPKLWPTICILLALAVLLGFAVMNKTELFGETTLSGEVGA